MSMSWPPIDSEEAFAAAVVTASVHALEQRCRALTFCSPDFDGWPLSDASLLSVLSAFARLPGRQLTLLASDYEPLKRRHSPFVAWRKTWGHAITALTPVDEGVRLPVALMADRTVAFELTDPEHWSGTWREAAVERQMLWEQVQGVMRRTEVAFAASVLGL